MRTVEHLLLGLQLRGKFLHAARDRKIIGGFIGEPGSAGAPDGKIGPGPRQHTHDLLMSGNDGEHQGTESKLGRDVQIGPMADQDLDDFPMTGIGGQHETGLAIAILGINIDSTQQEIAHDFDIATPDGIHPCDIHHKKLSM